MCMPLIDQELHNSNNMPYMQNAICRGNFTAKTTTKTSAHEAFTQIAWQPDFFAARTAKVQMHSPVQDEKVQTLSS